MPPGRFALEGAVLTIRLTSDLNRFAATLNQAARGQMRFAAAVALNQVARQTAAAVAKELLPQAFDRPVPFTRNAFRVIPATKQNLTAQITLKTPQQQAGYATLLGLEEHGGTRVGRAIVTPPRQGGLPLNAYGNLRRGATRAAAARKGVFWAKLGDIKGNPWGGLYQRAKGGRLKLLVSFRREVQYRPRLGFYRFVEGKVRASFPAAMAAAFARAMATRRRP